MVSLRPKALEFLRSTWAKPAGDFLTSKYSTGGSEQLHSEIVKQQRMLRARIQCLPAEPPLGLSGRGIVTAAGGRHIASLWVTLWLIRSHHQCGLPIQVWYLGDNDFPAHIRHHFARFDVTFVDVERVAGRHVMRRLTGWELKPFAIANSPFAEVLWIDADNVSLINPEALFTHEQYTLSGALFWPDIRHANPFNPVWKICDLNPPGSWEWESGQMLIDKTRSWKPLQLTLHLNRWSDFYYQYVLGDKETFHLAWRLLRSPFSMIETPAEVATGVYGDATRIQHTAVPAIWQHDSQGHRIFLHRTGSKWSAWGRNIRCDGFDLHDTCVEALEELKLAWNGRYSSSSSTSPVAPSCDPSGGTFQYLRIGMGSRKMHLRPDGRVGHGVQLAETFWRIEREDSTTVLYLSGRGIDTCRLALEPDGVWRGHWLEHERTPVEMIPIEPLEQSQHGADDRLLQHLLYITPVVPSDTGNGLAMRAAATLDVLTRQYRVSVLIVPIYASGPGDGLPAWIQKRCQHVRWAEPPQSSAEPQSDALQNLAWRDNAARAYWHEQFDVVHLFRTAVYGHAEHYLTRASGRAVEWHIDLDDVESRKGHRLSSFQNGNSTENQLSTNEHRAIDWESQILRTWDRVYVCSTMDRDYLDERYPARRADIVVLPNSISLPTQAPMTPRDSTIQILMVGTFGYEPNADAAIWFCREILPIIREHPRKPVHVALVGTGAPPSVTDLRHIPEVEFVGPVRDLAPWYEEAHIVIVPLRAGRGTRIKILEALSFRRPVVTTSIGAEGLDLSDEQHVLVADRAYHFARQCLRLIDDQELAERIAGEGFRRVAGSYTRDAVAAQVIEELQSPSR
jgi:glycosyltransferase involved in cell wall biosynthesis